MTYQPELPIMPRGLDGPPRVPFDEGLRRSLYRWAARVEGDGPAGLEIDLATEAGRAAWRDVERAIEWIYAHANTADRR